MDGATRPKFTVYFLSQFLLVLTLFSRN